ncbi:DinB family protein [Leeia aquatica]|uniref:DinB family protein n=1 Tax=Leeia aquatica TaxID=2725557 RepID=A0A847S2P0_9NEIS|nr:DinB family protein [Leeia aquatica]NLR74053.1 DinB family protein [Leeia aquatica]
MYPAMLDMLRAFPADLEACYALFPPHLVNWKPSSWEGIPSESLSAIEQICHVWDIEKDGYHVRFQRVLSEDNPTLVSLDTDALVISGQYSQANANDVLAAFKSARLHTLDLLSNLTETQLRRSADFPGYGKVTMHGLIHFLCSHDQQHLAGLHWLLGKIHSSAASLSA